MNKKEDVLIIGAGLCGALLALRLAQRGYEVAVYESRSDLRTNNISSGRSINLALSDRGLKALRLVGLEAEVRKICIPMYGRLIHNLQGNTFISKYSGRANEYINSISRGELNALLLDKAEAPPNVTLYFNKKCTSVNLKKPEATFVCSQTDKTFSVQATVIFGADGAGSVLRKSYNLEKNLKFHCSQNYLNHGYKELEIPADSNGKHQLSKNHLHIWPRGNYMLIALPNLEGSFTVTLFLGYRQGEYHFDNLSSKERITKFFETQFPDALPLIPNIQDAFFDNPTGALGTVKCAPWYYRDKTLLIGDAAHAIVPFYGQGMNAAFEDVTILDAILEEHPNNWEMVFKHYQQNRKPNTDAIADLAIDNFYEMRDHVTNPLFQQKRKIEIALEEHFPTEYFSKYAMVTFDEKLPYAQAMTKGRAQDECLLKILADSTISKNLIAKQPLETILKKVQKQTNTILEQPKG